MLRIAFLAAVFAALAGLVMTTLEGGLQLGAWLLVVGVAASLLIRGVPSTPSRTSLLRPRSATPASPPRYWAESSLVVRSALSDSHSGQVRLRPYLRRIAEHRLARRGLKLGSAEAEEMLGDEVNAVLRGDPGGIGAEELSAILDRLERL